MIVCFHCLHHNPNEAVNCEACGVKLPDAASCQNCGSSVQDNAHFCGQCGYNLRLSIPQSVEPIDAIGTNSDSLLPDPVPPEPVFSLDYVAVAVAQAHSSYAHPGQEQLKEEVSFESSAATKDSINKDSIEDEASNSSNQAIRQRIVLLHEQSDTRIEFPPHQTVIHIGKPNDRVPPDINVSVFTSSEVVSRVHADLHIENGNFFIEDVGSANGTYLNNMQLAPGTRYRLRNTDRICLGKGDLVTFIFQMS